MENITHYLDGFQYTEDHLNFFPHAEGYVNVPEFEEFNYVYTYKDYLEGGALSNHPVDDFSERATLPHCKSLRYAKNPDTQPLAILEEDHYYPFGLEHKGYNNVVISTNPGQNYKHQGQERQDEFSLNWDSFKWRSYDYAIGRLCQLIL